MANDLRRRKDDKTNTAAPTAVVAADDNKTDASPAPAPSAPKRKSLTATGRFTIFLGFPFTIASIGLFFGYLRTIRDPEQKLNIDTDFIFPFLLALVMVVVIGFQTNNFQGKAKPLVTWPKVKRRKKIVHKTVIVDDEDMDGDEGDDDKEHND